MAIWKKLFSKIIFKNYPDTSTPINADNLNKMTDAIDGIDNRVVELNSNFEMKTATLNKNYIAMNICSVCGVKYIRCSTHPNGNMTSGQEYPVGTLATAFWPTYKVSQKVDTGSGEGWLFINNLTGEVSFSPLVDMTTSTNININFAYI